MIKIKVEYFIDSACFIALLNRQDSLHQSANTLYQKLLKEGAHYVTTSSVIEETSNALSSPLFRSSIISFYHNIAMSPLIEIVFIDPELWYKGWDLFERRNDKGWDLFERRNDKGWSLTDCISFTVMKGRNIKSALTSDRHFIQAGFEALLITP